ncbi:MAG: N-acetylmuramoyl-L-alanine amidase, partial [Streptomyces sp.]|nr:N-acetylmuramoyl-L-alanine amidase [Streptomyces sp.]
MNETTDAAAPDRAEADQEPPSGRRRLARRALLLGGVAAGLGAVG